MIILFDLDNTLIDTQRIKREIFYDTAVVYGLSIDDAKEIYKSVRNIDGKVILSPQSFATAMAKKVGRSAEVIESKMYEKLNILGKSLCLDGAGELLERSKKENLDMYIMTLGVHAWQEEKIQCTGLDEYFPKEKRILPAIDLSEKDAKVVALKNFFGIKIHEEKSILFNDKPAETAQLLEAYPNMKAFVRWDTNDERFTKNDFEKFESIFGKRFMWSESLFELKDIFEYFLQKEYGQE